MSIKIRMLEWELKKQRKLLEDGKIRFARYGNAIPKLEHKLNKKIEDRIMKLEKQLQIEKMKLP